MPSFARNSSDADSYTVWVRRLAVAGLVSASCFTTAAIAQDDEGGDEAAEAMEEEVAAEPSRSRCLGIKPQTNVPVEEPDDFNEGQASSVMTGASRSNAGDGRCRGAGTGGKTAAPTLVISNMSPTVEDRIKVSGTCPGEEEGKVHFVAHQNGTTLAFKTSATGGKFSKSLALDKVLLKPGPATIAAFCPGDEVLTSQITVEGER